MYGGVFVYEEGLVRSRIPNHLSAVVARGKFGLLANARLGVEHATVNTKAPPLGLVVRSSVGAVVAASHDGGR